MKEEAEKLVDRAIAIVKTGWCQGSNARNKEGLSVGYYSDEAKTFCLLGAIYRAETDLGVPDGVSRRVRHLIYPFLEGMNLDEWNDQLGRNQSEVVAVLEKVKETL